MNCPINLDCGYYDQEDFPPYPPECINLHFCKHMASPWPLPFRKKHQFLEVVIPSVTGTQGLNIFDADLPHQYYEELAEAGWRPAERLPFDYCPWENIYDVSIKEYFENYIPQGLPFPVLVVNFFYTCKYSGQLEPKYDPDVIEDLQASGWDMAVGINSQFDEF